MGFRFFANHICLPGALLRNNNQQYICKNIYVKDIEDKVYKIPIAHGEGRYYADEKTLDRLGAKRPGDPCAIAMNQGNITPEANPNGSVRNIAGICNEAAKCFWHDAAPGKGLFIPC